MDNIYFIDINTILPTHSGSACWILQCATTALSYAITAAGEYEAPDFKDISKYENAVWEAYMIHCIKKDSECEDFGYRIAKLLLNRDLTETEIEYARNIMNRAYCLSTTMESSLLSTIDKILASGSYVYFFGNCMTEEKKLLENIFGSVIIKRSLLSCNNGVDMNDLTNVVEEIDKIVGGKVVITNHVFFCTNKMESGQLKLTQDKPEPMSDRLQYQRDIIGLLNSIENGVY